jgi:hypothetical protein
MEQSYLVEQLYSHNFVDTSTKSCIHKLQLEVYFPVDAKHNHRLHLVEFVHPDVDESRLSIVDIHNFRSPNNRLNIELSFLVFKS